MSLKYVSDDAWNALTTLAEGRKTVVDRIIKLLGDADVNLRFNAVTILGEIGEDARPALPALKTLIEKEQDKDVKNEAIEVVDGLTP